MCVHSLILLLLFFEKASGLPGAGAGALYTLLTIRAADNRPKTLTLVEHILEILENIWKVFLTGEKKFTTEELNPKKIPKRRRRVMRRFPKFTDENSVELLQVGRPTGKWTFRGRNFIQEIDRPVR